LFFRKLPIFNLFTPIFVYFFNLILFYFRMSLQLVLSAIEKLIQASHRKGEGILIAFKLEADTQIQFHRTTGCRRVHKSNTCQISTFPLQWKGYPEFFSLISLKLKVGQYIQYEVQNSGLPVLFMYASVLQILKVL